MKYVDAVLKEPSFLLQLRQLEELEKNRNYCRHDFRHSLDTARIAWIYSFENKLLPEKEQIYLSALLHDLGRVDEYKTRISHDKASAAFAGEILRQVGYDEKKTEEICYAIGAHRRRAAFTEITQEDRNVFSVKEQLAIILAKADQLSRNCFVCSVRSDCKWLEEEKTKGIII